MGSMFVMICFLLLWGLVLLETVILCALARKLFGLGSSLLAQIASDGPRLGTILPQMDGLDTHKQPYRLGGACDKNQVILFLTPFCGACRVALVWLPTLITNPDFYGRAVMSGTVHTIQRLCDEHQFHRPLIPDPNNLISGRLGVNSAPYMLILSKNGVVIGKGSVSSMGDVYDLLRIARMREAMGGVPVLKEVAEHAV
jgi:hypothetical protein